MFRLYREAFKATNEGIILAIPLALFWWVITFYINFSVEIADTFIEMLISAVTMIFMISAFFSGWFYMVKRCVNFTGKQFIFDRDKNLETVKLIKSMPKGIGTFFLDFVVVSVMFIFMTSIIVLIMIHIGMPYAKETLAIISQYGITEQMSSNLDLNTFLSTLPADKIIEIFNAIAKPMLMSLLIVLTIPSIFFFTIILWIPEIIYTKQNPLLALISSVGKVYKNFKRTLLLFLYMMVIQIVISLVGSFSLLNPLTYLITAIIYFYFWVYMIVLLFMYYDKEFRK